MAVDHDVSGFQECNLLDDPISTTEELIAQHQANAELQWDSLHCACRKPANFILHRELLRQLLADQRMVVLNDELFAISLPQHWQEIAQKR